MTARVCTLPRVKAPRFITLRSAFPGRSRRLSSRCKGHSVVNTASKHAVG